MAALVIASLTGCAQRRSRFGPSAMGPDSCACVTRRSSAIVGAPLNTWCTFDTPAVGELSFLSIRGDSGITVFVSNQHRMNTAVEIDNIGPDLFLVPAGTCIQIRCTRRQGASVGCRSDYRFRWLSPAAQPVE
jgi:hypothetical protein